MRNRGGAKERFSMGGMKKGKIFKSVGERGEW